MLGHLVVIAGPDQGRIFTFREGQPLVIGRGEATETHLTDPQVLRMHCQVEAKDGKVVLSDSGSRTGTLCNGQVVTQHELQLGDVIQIGTTQLRYQLAADQKDTTVVPGQPLFTALGGSSSFQAPPQYRHLKCATDQGVLILTITKEQLLDELVLEALRLELLAAVSSSAARNVVLDFHQVKYFASAAYRVLISLQKMTHERGGHLVLCNLSALVAEILRLTGLIGAIGPFTAPFDTQEDLPSAMACLNRQE
jgi:anti-anti-sigma factor